MSLTTEQIEKILDGAPEGATHYGDYAEQNHYLKDTSAYIRGEWHSDCELFVDDTHDLSALREILTLRQRVQKLEIAIEQSLGNIEYAAFNLCETMDLVSRVKGLVVES